MRLVSALVTEALVKDYLSATIFQGEGRLGRSDIQAEKGC